MNDSIQSRPIASRAFVAWLALTTLFSLSSMSLPLLAEEGPGVPPGKTLAPGEQADHGVSSVDESAADIASIPQRELVIGTKVAAPFAIKNDDGTWRGLSIDLWRAIADDLNLEYRFEELPLQELLRGVEDGRLDAAVAALTMTPEREAIIDFSHPYYTSGLGIAVPSKSSRWMATLRGLLSLRFLQIVLALAAILMLAAVLVWLFERKHNEDHFGGGVLQGLGNAFWWSAVTMTTVGYGDKAPASIGGRVVALIWMFAGVIMISSFTAGIASSLTVNDLRGQVQGPDDLSRVHVSTVEGTTSESYLASNGIRHTTRDSIESALDELRRGETDAVVFDAPILLYLARAEEEESFTVLPGTFVRQDYGIALPEESPLIELVDRAILEHIRRPAWQEVLFDYLGTTQGGS